MKYNTGNQNSRIENHLGVIRNLLDDIAHMIETSPAMENFRLSRTTVRTDIRKNIDRDYQYIARRYHHEGLSFLTTSLPILGKWYDGLIAEQTFTNVPDGFKPHYVHSVTKDTVHGIICVEEIPRLFSILYCILCDDVIIPLPEKAWLIRAFRTCFFLYYKLEVPLDDDARNRATSNWYHNEELLSNWTQPDYYDEDLCHVRNLIADVVGHGTDLYTNIRPCHGSGAVAGGEDNEEKWETINFI